MLHPYVILNGCIAYQLVLEPSFAQVVLIGHLDEYLSVTVVGDWLYGCEHFNGCGLCVGTWQEPGLVIRQLDSGPFSAI